MKAHQNISKKLLGWSAPILMLIFFGSIRSATAQAPIIEMQKSLGGSGNDYAKSVVQAADGNYVIAGGSVSNDGNVGGNHGSSDFWVVKINPAGAVLWQNSLGGPGYEVAWDIKQTNDGGYIVTGIADNNGGDVTGNHGGLDVWVVKLNASGTLVWQKSLGGSANDGGTSIEQTVDGGYIVAAYSESSDGDVSDAIDYIDYWVVKLSATGTIQWEKSFGGTEIERPTSIFQTSDGGYLVAGFTNSTDGHITSNHGGDDYWLVKMDANGDLQWQQTYGGSSQDVAHQIIPTPDGGYAIGGYTNSNNGDVSGNNGGYDFWLVKVNNVGVIQWQKTLGGSSSEFCYALQKVNSGYVLVGSSASVNGDVGGNNGGYDYWIAKVNNAGTMQWEKNMGGSDEEEATALALTNDGGFLLAGSSGSSDGDVTGNHGINDYWVVKLATDPLAIQDRKFDEIVVFPNPVSKTLHIETAQNMENIRVFNLLGQEFLQQSLQGNHTSLDMSGLYRGMYLIHITFDGGVQTFRIQKK